MQFTVREAKGNFLDRQRVLDAVDRGAVKALSKWGAYVRTDARTSLRYRSRPSDPGKPPSAHKTMQRKKTSKKTGETKTQGISPLREFLFFAYDPSSRSVVAGPARLSGKLGNAPRALEEGGPSEVRATVWENHRPVRTVVKAQIRPHPTMGPAAKRTNARLGELFRDSVRG